VKVCAGSPNFGTVFSHVCLSELEVRVPLSADLSVHMLLLGAKVAATQYSVARHLVAHSAADVVLAEEMSLPR